MRRERDAGWQPAGGSGSGAGFVRSLCCFSSGNSAFPAALSRCGPGRSGCRAGGARAGLSGHPSGATAAGPAELRARRCLATAPAPPRAPIATEAGGGHLGSGHERLQGAGGGGGAGAGQEAAAGVRGAAQPPAGPTRIG